jgi:hypothetical protein
VERCQKRLSIQDPSGYELLQFLVDDFRLLASALWCQWVIL